MKFFEDIKIGEGGVIGRHHFAPAEIKRFAARFDPQPFHMNEEAAKQSHFGALCASGWHTAAACMRLIIDHQNAVAAQMKDAGQPVAQTGVSPGFKNLKWLKPVYANDTLTYSAEVIGKREVASRPTWGLVFTKFSAVNQKNEPVYEFEGALFVQRRPV
jgi:acyl dehydratase